MAKDMKSFMEEEISVANTHNKLSTIFIIMEQSNFKDELLFF